VIIRHDRAKRVQWGTVIAVVSVSLEAPVAALVCGVAAFWLAGH
jgi:hypothetical protein